MEYAENAWKILSRIGHIGVKCDRFIFGFLYHMHEAKRGYVRRRTTKKVCSFVYQPMGETIRHGLESGVTGQLGMQTFF